MGQTVEQSGGHFGIHCPAGYCAAIAEKDDRPALSRADPFWYHRLSPRLQNKKNAVPLSKLCGALTICGGQQLLFASEEMTNGSAI